MVIRTCPYSNEQPQLSQLPGKQNLVALHQAATDYVPAHTGPLSVKYVLKGREHYELDKRCLTVDDNCFLVLNKGQEYASSIQEPTVSLCVFFSDDMVADLNDARSSNLLSATTVSGDWQLYQKCYPVDRQARRLLQGIAQQLQPGRSLTQLALDEWCLQLLSLLYGQQQAEWQQLHALKAAKAATREEVYRRLVLSVDYMHQHYSQAMTLKDLATVSCLSSFHYHRLFKATYHCTPGQYLSRLRLQYAEALLLQGRLRLSDICLACGFGDTSSFIRLFKKHYGYTPLVYRSRSK